MAIASNNNHYILNNQKHIYTHHKIFATVSANSSEHNRQAKVNILIHLIPKKNFFPLMYLCLSFFVCLSLSR